MPSPFELFWTNLMTWCSKQKISLIWQSFWQSQLKTIFQDGSHTACYDFTIWKNLYQHSGLPFNTKLSPTFKRSSCKQEAKSIFKMTIMVAILHHFNQPTDLMLYTKVQFGWAGDLGNELKSVFKMVTMVVILEDLDVTNLYLNHLDDLIFPIQIHIDPTGCSGN